jgi:hypothetical protein
VPWKSALENASFTGKRCQPGDLRLSSAQQECDMKFSSMLVAGAAVAAVLGVMATDPAAARAKHARHHKVVHRCASQPQHEVTLFGIFFNPAPQPNGCAPPVYAYGRYVGQDPDPYIRLQLKRDPITGYSPF